MSENILQGEIKVGPDGSGSYRYGIEVSPGQLIISKHHYHNAASAWFDARRMQVVTVDGFLVPDSRWNPDLN